MITYLLAVGVKSVFVAIIGLVHILFGPLWDSALAGIQSFLALPGVGVGLAFVDTFVGLDFIVWATGAALTVVVTMRLIRLIIGIFSKG